MNRCLPTFGLYTLQIVKHQEILRPSVIIFIIVFMHQLQLIVIFIVFVILLLLFFFIIIHVTIDSSVQEQFSLVDLALIVNVFMNLNLLMEKKYTLTTKISCSIINIL